MVEAARVASTARPTAPPICRVLLIRPEARPVSFAGWVITTSVGSASRFGSLWHVDEPSGDRLLQHHELEVVTERDPEAAVPIRKGLSPPLYAHAVPGGDRLAAEALWRKVEEARRDSTDSSPDSNSRTK